MGLTGISDRVLPRRLAEAINDAKKCKLALNAFTEGLESDQAQADQVAEWRAWVEVWEKENEHTIGAPCPFEYTETCKWCPYKSCGKFDANDCCSIYA
jgi:hypothetical protein